MDDDQTVFSLAGTEQENVGNTVNKQNNLIPVITVIFGNDKGKFYSFDSEVIIGRGAGSDFIINDNKMSRSHLKVSYINNTFELDDLSSSNGTYVDEKKINNCLVSSGSVVKMGSTILVISLKSELQIKEEEKLFNSHKHQSDSINNAAHIQSTIISDTTSLQNYFKDYFIIWEPKDIVSGDIYFIEEISSDEILIFIIDCVGHGVSGAFITMSVKAIEQQILCEVKKSGIINTAQILDKFNQHIYQLRHEKDNKVSTDMGFDGAVLYYNKRLKEVKFSGASNTLFYIDDNVLKTIKGDRKSIGYQKPDKQVNYKEHIVKVNADTKFYLLTDGYLDQIGGKKAFSFGKKKFLKLIEAVSGLMMKRQKIVCLETLKTFQGQQERRDDITIIGLQI